MELRSSPIDPQNPLGLNNREHSATEPADDRAHKEKLDIQFQVENDFIKCRYYLDGLVFVDLKT